MKKQPILPTCGAFVPTSVLATPRSTYWSPSTGAADYPIDTGLTMGFLSFKTIQGMDIPLGRKRRGREGLTCCSWE